MRHATIVVKMRLPSSKRCIRDRLLPYSAYFDVGRSRRTILAMARNMRCRVAVHIRPAVSG